LRRKGYALPSFSSEERLVQHHQSTCAIERRWVEIWAQRETWEK
jgi:hypothetical protein